MPSTPNLYALFIGINAYPSSPLRGCINDVLAMRDYLQRLSEARHPEGRQPVEPHFRYLLAPSGESEESLLRHNGLQAGNEATLLEEESSYYRPSRENVIRAFEEHFSQADPGRGDLCLLFFSGHGSVVEAPAIFSEVNPSGLFQTLVLLDGQRAVQRGLVDKELGFLIARLMEGKGPDREKGIPGVHFLSIMDCCHSGSNSRSDEPDTAVRRLPQGPAVDAARNLLGFDPAGNVYYEKMVEINGAPKLPRGGIKHGRHISLAAARDAEKALEQAVAGEEGQKVRHGLFTYSLLRALEESGPQLTYGELIRRVQMEVRSRTENQIPLLGKSVQQDESLFFLANRFQAPKREYEVAQRDGQWYLNAGAIHGIVPGGKEKKTCVKVWAADGKTRTVEVVVVGVAESRLDSSAFSEAEKGRSFTAVVEEMPFPSVTIGFDDKLPEEAASALTQAFSEGQYDYIRLTEEGTASQYVIRAGQDEAGFVLTRRDSTIPLFISRREPGRFLRDANKVGKWESVLKMDNSDAATVRQHRGNIQIEARTLEGHYFDGNSFNAIPENAYKALEPDPQSITLSHRTILIDGSPEDQQPALRLRVSNRSEDEEYWAGALYLNNQFGISHRYADVQKLSAWENNTALELKYEDEDGNTYEGIPLALDETYHRLGISEITDYVLIFVSNRPFSLAQYYQEPLPIYGSDAGRDIFEKEPAQKDYWFTIKIPIHIRNPIGKAQLPDGGSREMGGITLEAPAGFTAMVQPTNLAAARRRTEDKSRAMLPVNALLPPGRLWTQTEGSEAVFSSGLANAGPDDYISILELTEPAGTIDEQRPLRIKMKDKLPASVAIVPFAFDPEFGLYYPVGYTNAAGEVVITQLPPETAGIIGGLGDAPSEVELERSVWGSIKLFFHKVVWSKITGVHDYHRLTLLTASKKGKVKKKEYRESPRKKFRRRREAIGKVLAEAAQQDKPVLLMIHGFTGDSEQMTEGIFQKTELHREFGAVLAFDYESLHSSLQSTARRLAIMLHECGLRKQPVIVLSHSMGGLVARWFVEQEGGHRFCRRLIQAGSPNGGAELASLRKRLSNYLFLSMNGVKAFESYTSLGSFIWKNMEEELFRTVNQISPGSDFLQKLNAASQETPTLPYYLLAGNTEDIKSHIEEDATVWERIRAAIKQRGKYLFFDKAFFEGEPNDWIITIRSMKALPWGHDAVEEVACDHMSYFDTDVGLAGLKALLAHRPKA